MDISDIQAKLTEMRDELETKINELRCDALDAIVTELEAIREALSECVDDFDSALSEHAEAIAATLDQEVSNVADAGPGEDESTEHHDAWIEGYEAAAQHIRDQYV